MKIGMVGLGRMGMNMARRLLRGGHGVAAFNRTPDKTRELMQEGAEGCFSLAELVSKLPRPRLVWLMLPAGAVTDQHVEALQGLLDGGDLIVEGGNSHFRDDLARAAALKPSGIRYLDAGVSGGIWGLQEGYCTMVGGEEADFALLEPVFRTLAPEAGYLHCGPVGAGHYVKMIHNAIEYGMMEAYGEGFALLEASPYRDRLDFQALASLWNRGSVIRSWLLELLEKAFAGDPRLTGISGYVEDSGEGRWSVDEAVANGVAAPVIALALFQRFQSRAPDSFANRVLAALRREFGGHAVKKAEYGVTEPMENSAIHSEFAGGPVCDAFAVGRLEPCCVVIFGASGDLAARKLIPALYRMHRAGSLPRPFALVGCARSALDDDRFRSRLETVLSRETGFDAEAWQRFAANLHYFRLDYDEGSFQSLAAYLRELDRVGATQGNRLFHLAVPPSLYGPIAELLGAAGLSGAVEGGAGWIRIVVEKPFGRDLKSAVALDAILHRHFQEPQILRIDHYLAKETVQNVLLLRFANAIFEPLWNRNYIDHVGILAAESLGIERRASYYEEAGVIRDMFQNHMLQLLALCAMEPPSHFEAERVRDEKVKVLRSLRPFSLAPDDNLVLGQYRDGRIDGGPVVSYRSEEGVAPESLTPTFALMRLFVDNWRWKGVPFYLVSGKRLQRKTTKIVIQFREVPHTLFRDILPGRILANRLELGVYPEEGISLSFQAKEPGPRLCLNTMTMDFSYRGKSRGEGFDPYAKMLLDAMLGDQMLFWRQDAVEVSWALLTPILHDCEACRGRAARLHFYEAGTWGPEAASDWVRRIVGAVEP